MKKVLTALLASMVLVMSLGVFGCGSSSNSGGSEQQATTSEQPAKYEVTDEAIESAGFADNYYITGTLTNNSGKDISYVQVEYVLLDSDGNQIGTGFANTNNLAKDGSWKFKALASSSGGDPASYRLADVTGF